MRPCFLTTLLTALHLVACGPETPERRILTDQWDTVDLIRPESVDDTTLLFISQVVPWKGTYAVQDGQNRNIRRVSTRGDLLWTFERPGEGPGEAQSLVSIQVGPNGRLWAYDYRGVKMLELDGEGTVVRDRSLRGLPGIPTRFGFLGDKLVVTTQIPDPYMMVLDTGSLELVRAVPWPWPEPATVHNNFHTVLAGGSDALVLALMYGPGFMVLRGDEIERHRYIDPIPWQRKFRMEDHATGADSTRFGAVSIAVDNGRIYMLFGGRPYRAAHPFEPTTLIDVYGLDGSYIESYRLPSHFEKMTRINGDFLLAEEAEDGMPQILRLSPKGIDPQRDDRSPPGIIRFYPLSVHPR